MSASTFKSEDFQPVQIERQVQVLTRPSLSYWQDAWRRLRANPRAIISLYTVLLIVAAALFGPLVWTMSPAAQDLDQISVGPSLGVTARLIDPWSPIEPLSRAPEASFQPEAFSLREAATTQSVRLQWQPVQGASQYSVYRHILEPSSATDRGLPLATVWPGNRASFEDRLNIIPQRYYYSLVALDAAGKELAPAAVLAVEPERVITHRSARQRGLLRADESPSSGDVVTFAAHPLGTDYLGRDMLARLLMGARVSLFIGIVAPLLFVVLGTLYGGLAGYLGGWVDQLMMRFADFMVAVPFLLLMIIFRVASGVQPGESGISAILLAMVLLGWPATARLVRGQILQIREEGYVQAARLMGASTPYILLRHMVPNTLGVILVTLTMAVPTAIFTEAFLSYIGIGVAPPTPSWGSMCNEGTRTMLSHPHELLFPALFISITVLAFNLLGDGLRDALDARLRSRE